MMSGFWTDSWWPTPETDYDHEPETPTASPVSVRAGSVRRRGDLASLPSRCCSRRSLCIVVS